MSLPNRTVVASTVLSNAYPGSRALDSGAMTTTAVKTLWWTWSRRLVSMAMWSASERGFSSTWPVLVTTTVSAAITNAGSPRVVLLISAV